MPSINPSPSGSAARMTGQPCFVRVTGAIVEAIGAPRENVRGWPHDVPKEN